MSEEKAKQESSASLFPEAPGIAPRLIGIARLAEKAEVADTGHLTEYHTLDVRSILNTVVSRRGLPFSRSINPYRGCEFGCRYCYARYTHEFMELRDPEAFERRIFIKQKAAWLLKQELRKLHPGEEIGLGTATDPYQPIERRARVTQSLLEVMAECRGLKLGIVTKSTLILRDIDLLKRVAEHNQITVCITITTPDSRLARILEPRAPRPDLRFQTVARLRQAGIRTGILCCPVMPDINDTAAAMEAMAKRAKKADASFLAANPLFLKPCSKPTFLAFVRQHYPALETSYERRYAKDAFLSKGYHKRLSDLLSALVKKYGLGNRRYNPASMRISPELTQDQEQLHLWQESSRPPANSPVSSDVRKISA